MSTVRGPHSFTLFCLCQHELLVTPLVRVVSQTLCDCLMELTSCSTLEAVVGRASALVVSVIRVD